MLKHYDIIISGAGAAGASLANKLSHSKFVKNGYKTVLLLDKSKPKFTYLSNDPNQWELRTVAVSPGNVEFLQSMPKVWQQIENTNKIGQVKKMHVYDALAPSSNGITFNENYRSGDAQSSSQPNHGQNHTTETASQGNSIASIIETGVINRAVVETLPDNIETNFEYDIQKIEQFEYDSSLQLTPLVKINEELSCNLLIGADGGNSFVRQEVGFKERVC